MASLNEYEDFAVSMGITLPNASRRLQALSNLTNVLSPCDYRAYRFLNGALGMVPNLPRARRGRPSGQRRHSVSPASIAELVLDRRVAFENLQDEPEGLAVLGRSPTALLSDLEHRWRLTYKCLTVEDDLMKELMLYFGAEQNMEQFTNVRFATARVRYRRLRLAVTAVKETPWLKVYVDGFLGGHRTYYGSNGSEADLSSSTSSVNDEDCPICSCGLFVHPEDADMLPTDSKPEIASCPSCRQCLHASCLVMWIEKQSGNNRSCPLCRAVLSDSFQRDMFDGMAMQLEESCAFFSRLIEC